MLQEIHIRNFQSHAQTSIEFAPGVTVLTGTNDSGKSAVLRALLWAQSNRPKGTNFIKKGSDGFCEVRVLLSSGEVIRSRGPRTNMYIAGGETLTAIGSDIPPVVQSIFDLTDLNLSPQLEPHFLVLSPPGKISDAIADVLHLDKPLQAASVLASDLRELGRKAATLTEQQEAHQASLEGFGGLEAHIARLADAVGSGAILARSEASGAAIRATLADLAAVEESMRGLESLPRAEEVFDRADNDARVVADLTGIADELRDLLADLAKAEEMPGLGEVIALLDEILPEATEHYQVVGRLTREIGDLSEVLLGLEAVNVAQKTAKVAEVGAADSYNELLGQMVVCPTCGQALDDESLNHILECGT